MKKKKVYLLIMPIIILLISVLLFSCNKGSDNVTLDDVKLNAFNNKSFAILVTEDGNDYHECSNEICNNSLFPGNAYIYEKSICLDDKGATVDNALTFDSNTRKATVTSSKTLYCTLYFNKDTQVPTLTIFYINNQDANKYTNTNTVTIHMAWSDNDVKEYCVTNENSINNCIWNPTGGGLQKDDIIYTLPQTGLNTLYGFIRDNANNVSVEKYDSITYDTGNPIITSFYIKGNTGQPKYTNSVTRQEVATVTWNDDDIAYYCIIPTNNITDCDINSNWKEASNNYGTITVTLNEGSNTYYAFLKDKAGNKSTIGTSSSFDTIILDTIPPTINTNLTVANEVGQTTATITVVAEDTGSGVKQYCYSASNVDSGYTCGNYSVNVTIPLTGLEAGASYTYYIYAIDNADNSGTKVPVSFTTEKPANEKVIDNATGQIQSNTISGDTLRRFQGSNVTNNYICFGTSDSTTCKENQGTYMYRIIGVDTITNQLKVIKKEALDTVYSWNNSWSYYTEYPWNNVMLFKQLNGISTGNSTYPSNIFLTSTNPVYIPNENIGNSNTKWIDAIETHTWGYANPHVGFNNNASEIFTAEKKAWTNGESTSGTVDAKIGLMYLSDYYLAVHNGANCSGNGNTFECRESWIYLGNNDIDAPKGSDNYVGEWTMTSSGWNTWYIGSSAGNELLVVKLAVRPVFYLIPNIKLEGTGEIIDPYRITGIS